MKIGDVVKLKEEYVSNDYEQGSLYAIDEIKECSMTHKDIVTAYMVKSNGSNVPVNHVMIEVYSDALEGV